MSEAFFFWKSRFEYNHEFNNNDNHEQIKIKKKKKWRVARLVETESCQ